MNVNINFKNTGSVFFPVSFIKESIYTTRRLSNEPTPFNNQLNYVLL